MTKLARLKVVVGAVGVAVWAWGVRIDDQRVRWVGIALVAATFLLRLLNRRLGEPTRRR